MTKKTNRSPVSSNCRSQFLANAEEIQKLLEEGHKKKAIHRYLIKNGKMQMSYQAFLIILKDPGCQNPFAKERARFQKTIPPVKPASSGSPRSFKHDPTPLPVDFNFNQKKKGGK
ncbi:TraK family protein [Desulforhopalus singaporensis]|uniref:Uncharacterized protein n=1 Tax=Desulforhopalus singaporensis TaxID=91360 RepID=A0A1H0VK85_9BACT|nr:TraK family protein [Desulforhopalus singaporensis]SDP78754.1 hypothetical protein SAMN05660330_04113 [Desulforhopalus singaporensis]